MWFAMSYMKHMNVNVDMNVICHVTYTYECKFAMSYVKYMNVNVQMDVNLPCHIWNICVWMCIWIICHVLYETYECECACKCKFVMPYMKHMNSNVHMNVNLPCHICESAYIPCYMYIWMWMCHATHERVMVHVGCWHARCQCDMSRMTQSYSFICDTTQSYATCACDMSRMTESCHIWMSHATYEWVMSHMNESCHVWKSRGAYRMLTRLMSMRMCHVTRMTESCQTCGCDMSHMDESCHFSLWVWHVTYEWVMSHMNESCHIWMSHVTYERVVVHIGCWHARLQCECDMSPIRLSHVTHVSLTCHKWMSLVTCHYECGTSHMNESCHIWMIYGRYERVVLHMGCWHAQLRDVNVTCHTYDWVMSHTWVWHESRHI